MNLYVTRDSVCMADDVDAPHSVRFTAFGLMTADDVVRVVRQTVVLPFIDGGRATWCLSSKIPLAVIAQEWESARLCCFSGAGLDHLETCDGSLKLHFSYFAQLDPEMVYSVLRQLRLTAP